MRYSRHDVKMRFARYFPFLSAPATAMMTIALIACAASKLSHPAPAADLYTSQLFRKSQAFARQTRKHWFVLSAKHELLRPEEVVDPYEQTLNTMPRADREAWAGRVFSQLHPSLHPGDRITMLAGQRYREFLLPLLQREGYAVKVPLDGMRIGEQLQWLKRHTS